MPDILSQYYGMDWLSAITTIIGMHMISERKRAGFFFNIIGLIASIVVFAMANTYPLIVLNIALMVINMRGYMKWKRSEI